MTTYPRHSVIRTSAPAPATLRIMGSAAREASDTFALREWASRLATLARPRDYVGQLHALYAGILERWRYTQEPDEWVHGSAKSLIDHVAGTKYNTPPGTDSRSVRLSAVPSTHKGWGDCDDVSTLVAAGVRALGMTPYFRVARGSIGAHVSVVARTPNGKLISIDPVGHPTHPFGWSLPAEEVELFDLEANPVSPTVFAGVEKRPFAGVDPMDDDVTYLSGFDGRIRGKIPKMWTVNPKGDNTGPRALAIPQRYTKFLKKGTVIDGMPAIDERGRQYVYDAGRDLWINRRLLRSNLAGFGDLYGGLGSFKKRQARRRAKRRRVFKRIVTKIRGGLAKVMQSPIAQSIVGTALQVVGIPATATKAIMAVSGNILKEGGIPALVRLIKKDPKRAAQMVAQAAKMGIKSAVGLSGPEDTGVGEAYVMQQGGRRFHAQPVCALAGVPSLWGFGDLEIAATPTPGMWYRVQRGDTLYGVAGKAYGVGAGGTRLERARWINQVRANQYGFDPTLTDNLLKGGRLSFNPKFSADAAEAIKGAPGSSYAVYYIPLAPGDEPPAITPEEQIPPTQDIPPEVLPDPDPEADLPPTQDEEILPPSEDDLPPDETLPEVDPDPPGETIPPVDTTPQIPQIPHIPPELPQTPEVIPPQIPDAEIEPTLPDTPQIPQIPQTPEVIPPQIPDSEIEPILPDPPRPHIPHIPPRPQIPPGPGGGALPIGLLALLALTGDL